MRFEQAYIGWQRGRLTQEEAAELLGVCARSFRRYIDRYEDEGLDGLIDKRMEGISHLRAPVDEVLRLEALYKERYDGWTVKHFFERYQARHRGQRSYTWVKNRLQEAGAIRLGKRKGKHRQRRERKPLAGMMIHQDGSTHPWVPGHRWDLIVTLDDATSEIYSAFLVAEEGTWSSFAGVRETLQAKGLFSSFYSDRGSHYWHTPNAGGKVDKDRPTQFGRAMAELGIQMIPSYSPQARGRSERMFRTLQDRLPKELAEAGIGDMATANRFVREHFLPVFNARFRVEPAEPGDAFVPLLGAQLDDVLCLKATRAVGLDNCVSYAGKTLQIPRIHGRCHYARATVMVHEYADGATALFHGPRRLANYQPDGCPQPTEQETHKAAAA